MHLVVKEHCFAFTGFAGGDPSWGAISRDLVALGGRCSNALTPEVTVLIVGEYPGKKLARARLDGLVLLPLERVPELISSGELTLTHGDNEPTQTPHTLISECRAILAHPPSPWRWAALCAQLEQCDPALLPALVTYLQGALSHQHDTPPVSRAPDLASWLPTQVHLDADDAAHTHALYEQHVQRAKHIWRLQSPWSSSRHHHIAPDGWLGGLLRGERSPKCSLIRALDLSAHAMSGKRVTSLLAHEDISGLVALRLGAKNAMSRSFFASLVQQLERHPLEVLAIGVNKLTLETIAPLAHVQPIAHLNYLNIEAEHYDVAMGVLSWLGQQPMFMHVKALRYRGRLDLLDISAMEDAFPSLEQVIISPFFHQPDELWRVLAQLGAMPGLKKLTLSGARFLSRAPDVLARTLCQAFGSAQISLDMSRLEYEGWGEEGDLLFLRELVHQPGLLGHVRALQLGCYVDQVREDVPGSLVSKLCE